jgi:hypothetical protein
MKEARVRIVALESQVMELVKDLERVSKQDKFFKDRVN